MSSNVSASKCKLTWVVAQRGKGPQHIFYPLRGEVGQLVHQLPLQHLEQHGARVMVQRCKRPQGVAHVLAVELRQPLHGLSSHGTEHLPAVVPPHLVHCCITPQQICQQIVGVIGAHAGCV